MTVLEVHGSVSWYRNWHGEEKEWGWLPRQSQEFS